MDLAMIAPFNYLHYQGSFKYQMMLPLGLTDEKYQGAYRYVSDDKARLEGPGQITPQKFVILDNGMFEGNALSVSELLEVASDYKVDEVVAPDVANDPEGSFKMQTNFLLNVADDPSLTNLRVMLVVQGGSIPHAGELIYAANSMDMGSRVTFGFPRRSTEGSEGSSRARIETMERFIESWGKTYPLHMLGMSRTWPGELKAAARQFGPYVRSMDTSAPWVFAHAGRRLIEEPSRLIDRPVDYFNLTPDKIDSELLQQNLQIIQMWARGVTAPIGSSWL